MNWVILVSTIDWEISANLEAGVDNYFYKWEKCFIKIVSITATQKTITVNGEDYTVYSAGEELIIEVTDFVRAHTGTSPQTIPIIYGANDYSVSYIVINGGRSNEFKARLPKEIPFYTGNSLPFYVQLSEDMIGKDSVDSIKYYDVAFNVYGGVYSWDWTYERTSYGMKPFLYTSAGYYSHFIDQSCWTDKILVEWVSASGQLKSWWFQIDGVIYGSNKTLNLQTMENGYHTLKNKLVSVRVKHRNADNTTQNYLSDIAISDEVYVYEETTKIRVRLADNNFEVTQGKRDVQLMINKYEYDTI